MSVPRTATPPADRSAPPRRSVAAWVLYDFANTIFSLNIVSLYFPVWVVSVMGARDSAYAYANGLSMAVIFIASPLLGALTDQAPRRLPFLTVSTLICVGATFLLGQGGGVLPSLVLFGIANIAYQAGLQFYDALLPEVSTEANRGRIGGIGIGLGYLGSLVGLLSGRSILSGVEATDVGVPIDQTLTEIELLRWRPCVVGRWLPIIDDRRRSRKNHRQEPSFARTARPVRDAHPAEEEDAVGRADLGGVEGEVGVVR